MSQMVHPYIFKAIQVICRVISSDFKSDFDYQNAHIIFVTYIMHIEMASD